MDGLCLKPGIHGISPAAIGGIEVRLNPSQVSSVATTAVAAKKTTPFSNFSFRNPLRSFWTGRVGGGGGGGRGEGGRYGGIALDDAVLTETVVGGEEKKVVVVSGGGDDVSEEGTDAWILKLLNANSLRSGDVRGKSYGEMEDIYWREGSDHGGDDDSSGCCTADGDKKEADFNRDSFSRLLRRVSLAESRLYAQMSYLGNIAYCIPKIQTDNLLGCCNLRFVTSSIDKRESTSKSEKSLDSSEDEPIQDPNVAKNSSAGISASNAYQIAASAASYLLSHTRSILPFSYSKDEDERCSSDGGDGIGMASLMATTDSVTAVVAAKEEVKQAVADDLNSTHSSPCEWFVCDHDDSGTRFFVIQGSETLGSWLANLLFEPVQFEGLDVIVHRGIYEAAKGLYEQMLPEIRTHLKARGGRAKFRFTGHSLGGSLALLINLMLLIRNEAPVSALLPVVMFGAPTIMCDGDRLLENLGLPRSHVKAIMMHRDIVPRAFSCHYPNQVAELLKAVNGKFRNHPCLDTQNLLYGPMGDLLILQPDDKFSPNHHLLPAGVGLYLLTSKSAEKRLQAARVFLNSPHPLEILVDQSAYGSDGAIQRTHDTNSYLECIRGFIEQELSQMSKAKKESHRRLRAWWSPIVGPLGAESQIVAGGSYSDFSGMVESGQESLGRFSRLVASQHMHVLAALLFPARFLLLGAYSLICLMS